MPVNMPLAHEDKRLRCVQCKWYYVGFEGNTCRKTREVVADTQACIEFLPYKPGAFESIHKDKFLRELESSAQAFTDEFLKSQSKELNQYSKIYNKEKDIPTDPMDKLSDERMMAQSVKFDMCATYMERVLEIKHTLLEKSTTLQSLMKDAQAYLISSYPDQIHTLKNDTERQAFNRMALPHLSKAIDKLEAVLTKTGNIYDNLKNIHFALKESQAGSLEVWKHRKTVLGGMKGAKGVG
jgi:hypothetical protein